MSYHIISANQKYKIEYTVTKQSHNDSFINQYQYCHSFLLNEHDDDDDDDNFHYGDDKKLDLNEVINPPHIH